MNFAPLRQFIQETQRLRKKCLNDRAFFGSPLPFRSWKVNEEMIPEWMKIYFKKVRTANRDLGHVVTRILSVEHRILSWTREQSLELKIKIRCENYPSLPPWCAFSHIVTSSELSRICVEKQNLFIILLLILVCFVRWSSMAVQHLRSSHAYLTLYLVLLFALSRFSSFWTIVLTIVIVWQSCRPWCK